MLKIKIYIYIYIYIYNIFGKYFISLFVFVVEKYFTKNLNFFVTN